jgi:hypothetical protein
MAALWRLQTLNSKDAAGSDCNNRARDAIHLELVDQNIFPLLMG